MSADLTCPECKGTDHYFANRDFHGTCFGCDGSGRRRPELHEWDALKAERDQLRQQLVASEEEWRDLYLRERAERDRAKEAVRNLDKALRNAVKERGDALDDTEQAFAKLTSERDRYMLALETIRQTPFSPPEEAHRIASSALDSDPDLAERTRRIRADE